jgi:hypothetical protein
MLENQEGRAIEYYPPGNVSLQFLKSEAFISALMGPIGCLGANAEYLTPKGWKRMDQYMAGDLVAQWHPDTGQAQWVAPSAHHIYDCGELIRFDSGGLVMEVSEEHRIPHWDYAGRFAVKTGAEIEARPSKRTIPTTFKAPISDGLPMSDDMIRFAVMMHADGHYPKARKRASATFRKERKKERFKALMARLGIEWRKISGHIDRPTQETYTFEPPYVGKRYGAEWYMASEHQLAVIVDECRYWDGLAGPLGDHEEIRYFSSHKEDVDFVQYACHATGRRAYQSVVVTGNEGWAPNYNLYIRTSDNPKNRAMIRCDNTRISRVSTSDGKKYCFTVPTGFFVVRFEDTIFVTGNSGKSTACVMKLLRNASLQPMTASGFRRSRYAIIRNTAPQLKTTTMQTWHQWVPKNLGRWVGQGPPTHHIIDPVTKIDMEVWFVALDSPDDVKKLLSMELTGAWINEAREVPKVILDGLTGRVGRFRPSVTEPHLWPYNPQVIMDTNPPDSDHWWYVLSENDNSTTFGREMLRSMAEAESELRQLGLLRQGQRLFEFLKQPGAYDVGAENIENLPPGYYAKAKAGKTADWVDVYVNGKYGFVRDGKPVFPEYNDRFHCREFELIPGLPISVGLDFGLSPAAEFAQRTPEGQWRIHSEIVGEGMGLKRFAEAIRAHVGELYHGYKITRITGDPSGDNRSAIDKEERSTFQILASYKIHANPASTNNLVPRIAAVVEPLSRLINGEPGILIHPNCRILRKGMMGGYAYKRVQVIGDQRYQDKPDKNMYSHPADALQYLLLGGGEYSRIIDAGNESGPMERLELYTPAVDGVM